MVCSYCYLKIEHAILRGDYGNFCSYQCLFKDEDKRRKAVKTNQKEKED